jgi:hypothetical protein
VDVVINLQDVIVDLDDADLGSIPENSPAGTLIGTITPRDWPAADSLSYSILEVEDGNGLSYSTSAFQIVTDANGRDGHVEVVDPSILNFEPIAPGHVFLLRVQATDVAVPPNSDTAWHTFTLTDVNEAPTDVALAPDNIDENTDTSAGDVTVGNLSAAVSAAFDRRGRAGRRGRRHAHRRRPGHRRSPSGMDHRQWKRQRGLRSPSFDGPDHGRRSEKPRLRDAGKLCAGRASL